MGIKLCICDRDEDWEKFPPTSTVSIQEYLRSPPGWTTDLYKVIILFDELTLEANEDINSFGMLNNILPQLQEALDRLSEHQFAILRTAGEHQAVFFIFEPLDSTVLFSALTNLPEDYLAYFPLKNSPQFFMDRRDQRTLLYDFIENQRKSHPANPQYAFLEYLKNIEMDYRTLLKDLREQLEVGNELNTRINGPKHDQA